MVYAPMSELEKNVYDAYGRFSGILGRLQNIEYEVKTKKSPSGLMHVWIKPQHGCRMPGIRYPDEVLIPGMLGKSGNYVIMHDTSGGMQKRFIKYLQRELPGIEIKNRED